MRVLHTCILPVDQTNFLFSISLDKQEVIRYCVNMRQNLFARVCINIRLQRPNIRLGFLIVLVNRRRAIPQRFVELHLPENIKFMRHFQLQCMKITQTAHALLDILIVGRVAYPGTLQKFCDLIAVIRVNIGNIVTDVFISDGMIHCRFLTAVDKLVCALSWNAHNVLFVLTGKQEGTVGHSLFQDCDVRDFLRFCAQRLADQTNRIRFQLVGIAVDLTKLFVGIDFHNICRMHHPSCNDHAILIIECFFPKRTIILWFLAKFLYTRGHRISVLFYKVANTDHRIAASVFRYSYQLHFAIHTDIAFVFHKIADHIP